MHFNRTKGVCIALMNASREICYQAIYYCLAILRGTLKGWERPILELFAHHREGALGFVPFNICCSPSLIIDYVSVERV